jgi:hypothetical protein
MATSVEAPSRAARPRLRKWDLRRLGAARVDALLQHTYAVEAQIFDAIEPFAAYADRIHRCDAQSLVLWTFEDQQGTVIGYNFVFLCAVQHAGRTVEVLRSNAGILPAWRRHNLLPGAGIGPSLVQRLLRPSSPLYLYLWLSHPSGYALLDKYFDVMWPSPRTDPAALEVEDLVRSLNDRFGVRCPDPANPWLVATTTAVDDTPEATQFWRSSTRRSVRYYLERNPGFDRDRALAVLVPVTLGAIARLAVRLGLARIRKAWSAAVGS